MSGAYGGYTGRNMIWNGAARFLDSKKSCRTQEFQVLPVSRSRHQKPEDLRESRRKGKFPLQVSGRPCFIAVAPAWFCAEICLPLPFAPMTSPAAPDVGLRFVFCPSSSCFM